MYFPEKEVKLKDGRVAVLRSARVEDAADCLEYLRVTATETPFLLREPEENDMTLDMEEAFLRARLEDPHTLMLIARVDGEYAGNCGLVSMGNNLRVRHRCGMGIALYQKFCNNGLGRILIENVVEVAEKLGYEQMELEVVEGNDRAKHVYESLGFKPFGVRPHALKYKDGTYANEILMVKTLDPNKNK